MSQKVSSAGFNGIDGRLGRQSTSSQLTAIDVDLPPLKMFSCGWKHNIFLTKDGQVYACGDNSEGQLGPSLMASLLPTYDSTLSSLKPKWIATGDKITVLLTDDGFVYVCGSGWGLEPRRLSAPTKIIYVSCGCDIICGIGESGEFFVWGNSQTDCHRLSCESEICDCAAGTYQVFALATNGVLYVSGKSASCGQGKHFTSETLVPVVSLSGVQIKRIYAGAKHSIAIDVEGRVYACGANTFGQAGIGDLKKSNNFIRIPIFDNHPVKMASLGDTFSAFITESNELYTCGDGDEHRIGNAAICKIKTPCLADATNGHRVTYVSCGNSHMFVGEGFETPVHPGRAAFGLDSVHYNCPIQEQEKLWLNGHWITYDSSYASLAWTSFLPGDSVHSPDFGDGQVLGISTRGLVVDFQKDGKKVLQIEDNMNLAVTTREGHTLKKYITRSLAPIQVDTSSLSNRIFGFSVGDHVVHKILGPAEVVGVCRGRLWLAFEDDEEKVTTSINNDPFYLHKHLEIDRPMSRKIEYLTCGSGQIPVEKSPCDALMGHFEVDDLVDAGAFYGKIIGTFRYYAVVRHIESEALELVLPTALKILRRFDKPAAVSYRTLNGSSIELDVSCKESDDFMPNDRVLTTKGHATLIGKKSGTWWVKTDDIVAIGGGVGCIKSDSIVKLLRRVDVKSALFDGLDVSVNPLTDQLMADDLIAYDNEKYRVIGQPDKDNYTIENYENSERLTVSREALLENFDILYRAEYPASRVAFTNAGNALCLSVSSKDFEGTRFLPDDVVETQNGVGLVIGIINSNIAIQMDGDQGVSFYTSQAAFDSSAFKLIARRAVQSVIKPCLK